MSPEQVKADVIARVTGQPIAIEAEAGDPFEGAPLDAQPARIEVRSVPVVEDGNIILPGYPEPSNAPVEQFTSEELHNIRQLAIDKLVELNTSPFFNYVHSALPSIRNKAQAELKRRGDWED